MISIDLQKELNTTESKMLLDFSISINKGEFITLYGESGAGKTSVLRMISGLLEPDTGLLDVDKSIWFDSEKKINQKPQFRKVGFVFQDYALFPNMTIEENLKYAGDTKDSHHFNDIVETFELEELLSRKPDTLSGGQKQRAALARALVQKPDLLLLDEPLSALDRNMRNRIQDYILEIHKKFELTTILVSHDVGEIIKLSDRVICIDNGSVSLMGNPEEVFIDHQISGKFRFTGEVLSIEKEDVVYIVTVMIHNNVIKVIANNSEINAIQPGDKVIVASKAFNPVIYPIIE